MASQRGRFDDLELETMLLSRHITPMRQPRSSRRNLERSGYTLLSRIQAEGPMSIGDLSDALGLDVSTLNRQTAALRKSGHLERAADPEGGVARKFDLTNNGARDLTSDRRVNVAGLRRVMNAWPDRDVDELVRLLRRLNSDIERLDGRPWPRP